MPRLGLGPYFYLFLTSVDKLGGTNHCLPRQKDVPWNIASPYARLLFRPYARLWIISCAIPLIIRLRLVGGTSRLARLSSVESATCRIGQCRMDYRTQNIMSQCIAIPTVFVSCNSVFLPGCNRMEAAGTYPHARRAGRQHRVVYVYAIKAVSTAPLRNGIFQMSQ